MGKADTEKKGKSEKKAKVVKKVEAKRKVTTDKLKEKMKKEHLHVKTVVGKPPPSPSPHHFHVMNHLKKMVTHLKTHLSKPTTAHDERKGKKTKHALKKA